MIDPMLASCRILIVDDEEANVHLLARLLKRTGYVDVRTLSDAREVLAVVRDWHPDLVMLDLHMPHLDGVSLLLGLRFEQPPSDFLPVLVLTADVSHDALIGAMNAGANDFLTKPVELDEVLLRVRNLLTLRLSHEALQRSNSALATTLRQQLQLDERQFEDRNDRVEAMQSVVDAKPLMVYQPIINLATYDIVGFEALARFDSDRPTDSWFAEASVLGLGAELELAAIEAAFDGFDRADPEEFLSVNVSPEVMFDSRFADIVCGFQRNRVIVEITEHQPVKDYDALNEVCDALRVSGVRLAIDDAGAGYASLQHILMLRPDIIKFDIALTHGIDADPVKRALAASLLQFAKEVSATVTAEGIENERELKTLRTLDVHWGQGFHIGYPVPLADQPELKRAFAD
ncbi:MAG: EAL domain-containing response regulator [Acidimicrobiales bacterium]